MKLSAKTIEHLQPVLAWLEAGAPHKTAVGNIVFSMEVFKMSKTECGSICCIAGAINEFNKLGLPEPSPGQTVETCYKLADMIGLDKGDASELFLGRTLWGRYLVDLEHVTPREAAATLRNFMETGDVIWHQEETW